MYFLGYKDPIAFKNSYDYSEKLWNELPNYNWGNRKHRGLKNIVEMNNKEVYNLGIEYFSALLLNVTEYGIYFIPMIQYIGSKVVLLTSTPKFLSANINNYIFVSNNDIESITIKKMLFRKMMRVTITISGGIVFNLIVNKKEKLIAYQESNFKNFMNMYSK